MIGFLLVERAGDREQVQRVVREQDAFALAQVLRALLPRIRKRYDVVDLDRLGCAGTALKVDGSA